MAETPTDPTKPNDPINSGGASTPPPSSPGTSSNPEPANPTPGSGAAPQPPNPTPSPPSVGGEESKPPTPASGLNPTDPTSPIPATEPSPPVPNTASDTPAPDPVNPVGSPKPTTSTPSVPTGPTPTPPTDPVSTPEPNSTPDVPATATPMSKEEVGPAWLRTDPTVRENQDAAGQGIGTPDLSPNPTATETQPPWQQQTPGTNADLAEDEPKEGHFPVVIFVILVLGIVVAIGVFLFTQGVLPF